ELVLGFASDLDSVLAGLFAEPAAATLGGGRSLGVTGAGRVLGVCEGADDGDFLAVNVDFRRSGEPIGRETTGEPGAKLFSIHVIMITPIERAHKRLGPARNCHQAHAEGRRVRGTEAGVNVGDRWDVLPATGQDAGMGSKPAPVRGAPRIWRASLRPE